MFRAGPKLSIFNAEIITKHHSKTPKRLKIENFSLRQIGRNTNSCLKPGAKFIKSQAQKYITILKSKSILYQAVDIDKMS